MKYKYPVVTLCGSTKFKDEFIMMAEKLSITGNVVLSVGLFGHADGKFQTVITDTVKHVLDDLHRQKIEMSDRVFVINKNGYIGESTRKEIEYAQSLGKPITYLEPISTT